MKLLIACSLMVTAFVPLVSAGGFGASSDGYGDCNGSTNAFNSNAAYADTNPGVVSAVVSAQTFCNVYKDWSGGTHRSSAIRGGGTECDAVSGCHSTYFSWYSYDGNCNTSASTPVANLPLGCLVGGPPAVPKLLP